MESPQEQFLFKELTFKIIGIAMEVHRELGFGFLEKVYENALLVAFRLVGIKAEQQVPIKVYFKGVIVGEYIADILVEDKIILELKSQDKITDVHRAQTLNYLKATNLKVALILNFGKRSLEHERLVR
ncbi:MAG: GxxExxY protein [Acidobacteria bacterium]|nr:GxxExxY protein [Acidobacteriota bacterium]